ncbi:MAG: aminotransferase class I/II-fold pyridoxal phosphate-dependent enzyme [Pseudomonadales bacterium]|jgi:aspartate/methionine/tyrosine aminotransferase|nr:aminotransferase class I/II-fold pyridoxal phosphate-dependent enzyme [Pseudomonadales bacterium]
MTSVTDPATLAAMLEDAQQRHDAFRAAGLSLDLTRGKPATSQLDLSAELDGILEGDYRAEDGTDTRNYGGLLGIPECRRLGGALLGVDPARVMAAGNSSLTLMYLFVETAHLFGLGEAPPWKEEGREIGFLCPVPGYDRHFTVCESLGIRMHPVPLLEDGPDMDAVEAAVAADPGIKGIWCVPKYSNPTGTTYADAIVERLAALPAKAGAGFHVLWDNAYAVHDLDPRPPALANLMDAADAAGTANAMVMFASTSKISFAGAGVAFLASGAATLDAFTARLGALMIGWDKVNQLRHARMFPDLDTLHAHMRRQAEVIAPKFEVVERLLQSGLGNTDLAEWTCPKGGYFVSVDTLPGLATEVVALAAEAGVKLTPAGSTWPYKREPEDRNIRLAPTFPPLEDVERAMEIFVNSVRLASARRLLADR